MNPQTLRTLGLDEIVLIAAGRYAKVAATLSGLAYGLPNSRAVRQARLAIEEARLARILTMLIGHALQMQDDLTHRTSTCRDGKAAHDIGSRAYAGGLIKRPVAEHRAAQPAKYGSATISGMSVRAGSP